MPLIGKEQRTRKQYIHVKQAAKKLDVHPQTLKRWLKQGKLKELHVDWGWDRRGWIYINKKDIPRIRSWMKAVHQHR